jgi:hypothetical protein
MTLAEFLAARLDEDEAAAKAVTFRSRFTARVLREVAAGRKILAYGQEAQAKLDRAVAHPEDFAPGDAGLYVGKAAASRMAMRHLAAIWSDHPDWDDAWHPRHAETAPR